VALVVARAAQARAVQIDVSGSWQQNTDCGSGIVETRPVALTEDPETGIVAGGSFAGTECGQANFGGVRTIASCEGYVPDGLVDGLQYHGPGDAAAYGTTTSHFAVPFDYFGCAGATAAASLTTSFRLDGAIELDGGRAVRIVGTNFVPTYEFRDASGEPCLWNAAYDQTCALELRRNGVDVGPTSQTIEPLAGVTIGFDAVTTAGTVSVVPLATTTGDLPPDFELLASPLYYDVTTTAAFAGDVLVCLPYPDADDDGVVDDSSPPICDDASVCPNVLKILHREGGVFVNRTDSIDMVAHRICARTTTLSPFVLGAGAVCGDGIVDGDELCDAGAANGAPGQCVCTIACTYVAAGTACADDGNLCTNDACDGDGACVHAAEPQPSCKRLTTNGRSTLTVRDDPAGLRDALQWKWTRGETTTSDDLGDPVATTAYALCVYAQSGVATTLAASLQLPGGASCAGGPCWRESSRGFTFRDRAGAHSGVTAAKLVGGPTGLPQFLVKAKGPNVGALGLPMAPPVRAELRNSEGMCWSADSWCPSWGAP